ncbi:MAG: protein kinase [Gammaproteobacteria bacterium]|jgi:tRNA A-37 threonylcarbamoyl transferase component Bud32
MFNNKNKNHKLVSQLKKLVENGYEDNYLEKGDKKNPFDKPVLISKNSAYIILNQIGKGGTSIVYKAQKLSNYECVAIKVMDAQELDTEEECDRELEISKKVGFGIDSAMVEYEDRKTYFLIMPLYPTDLDDFIRNNPKLNYINRLIIALKATRALKNIHSKGILHNDMQPINILLNLKTNEVVIGDFGFSRYDSRPESKQEDISKFIYYVLYYILTGKIANKQSELTNGITGEIKKIFAIAAKKIDGACSVKLIDSVTLVDIENILEHSIYILKLRNLIKKAYIAVEANKTKSLLDDCNDILRLNTVGDIFKAFFVEKDEFFLQEGQNNQNAWPHLCEICKLLIKIGRNYLNQKDEYACLTNAEDCTSETKINTETNTETNTEINTDINARLDEIQPVNNYLQYRI